MLPRVLTAAHTPVLRPPQLTTEELQRLRQGLVQAINAGEHAATPMLHGDLLRIRAQVLILADAVGNSWRVATRGDERARTGDDRRFEEPTAREELHRL